MQFIYYMQQNTAIRREAIRLYGQTRAKLPLTATDRDALFISGRKNAELELEKCLK